MKGKHWWLKKKTISDRNHLRLPIANCRFVRPKLDCLRRAKELGQSEIYNPQSAISLGR